MDRFLPITISLMIILLGAIVGVIGYCLWASDQMTSEHKEEIVSELEKAGLRPRIVKVNI